MTKATNEVITHGGYLDRSIVNVAAGKVRKLVNEGHCPETALGLATPGSWDEYRDDVKAFLRTGTAVKQPEPRPGSNLNGTRKGTATVTKTQKPALTFKTLSSLVRASYRWQACERPEDRDLTEVTFLVHSDDVPAILKAMSGRALPVS